VQDKLSFRLATISDKKLIPIVEKIDAEFFGVVKKTEQQLLITALNRLVQNEK